MRAVILRVLRPSAAKTLHPDTKVENGAVPELHAIDMSDANAGQEVDLAYENFKEIDPLDVTKDGVDAWETAQKRYVIPNRRNNKSLLYFMDNECFLPKRSSWLLQSFLSLLQMFELLN